MKKAMGMYFFTLIIIAALFTAPSFSQELKVDITTPVSGQHFANCADIPMAASVQKGAADIKNVIFYFNQGLTMKTLSKLPYEFNWENIPAGFYKVWAKVTDKSSNIAYSDTIYIVVGEVTDGNILPNGQFDCRQWPWQFQAQQGAVASWVIDPEFELDDSTAAIVLITAGGSADWHIQLHQGVPIDSGHTYFISFVAAADEDKPIAVAVQENKDPWTVYSQTNVTITTPGPYGPFQFDCMNTDPGAYLRFNVGNNITTFYLDAVEFIDPMVSGVTPEPVAVMQPGRFALGRNYPNPFNSSTTVKYQLAQNADVKLEIYNMRGQQVLTLIDENQTAGDHEISWDGKFRNSIPAPSGMYICRMTAKAAGRTHAFSTKMLLLQ
ncbi:carbohydrate binding domain-containing protein [bacterium]|nr:carbohydrate binding domain-containing protein [bacterium]